MLGPLMSRQSGWSASQLLEMLSKQNDDRLTDPLVSSSDRESFPLESCLDPSFGAAAFGCRFVYGDVFIRRWLA